MDRWVLAFWVLTTVACTPGAPAIDAGVGDGAASLSSTPCGDRCPAGARFRCAAISQGIEQAPDAAVPMACGCFEICPPGQFTIINGDVGIWCDGSPRGSSTCSTELPP